MATPTTTINALPTATTPLNPADLIIVQQSSVTKQTPVASVITQAADTVIDDTTADTDTTYSSTKIEALIAAIDIVIPPGIAGITVLENGTTIDNTVTALDFRPGFDLVEGPEDEINISLNLSEYTGPVLPLARGGTGSATAFAGSAPGVVPTSLGGVVNYLRADGTWTQPPGGGGAAGHASFTYNATTSAPPATGGIRMNNANQLSVTQLWVSQNDVDGLDVTIGLDKILAGHQIYIQDFDDASKWVKYNVTTAADSGAYFTYGVSYASGPGGVPPGSGAAGRIEFQQVSPGTVGVPPGGTQGQALTKSSSADYAVGWNNVVANVNGNVTGIWAGSQAAYDALGAWSPTVLYLITA